MVGRVIRIIIEIIIGIGIISGVIESFKLEGEEKAYKIIGTTIMIIIEMILIGAIE